MSLLRTALIALAALCAATGAHAQITRIGAASAATGGVGGTSATVTTPAGTTAGDVMVAIVSARGSPQTILLPAGWTAVAAQTSIGTYSQRSFWRVAIAAEPASHTFSWTASDRGAAVIVTYRGVDTTTPVDASAAQATAASGTITAPSVTTTLANTVLVGFFGIAHSGASFTLPSPAMINVFGPGSEPASGAGPNGLRVLVSEEPWAAAGATGSRLVTSSQSADNAGRMVALRPIASFTHYAISVVSTTVANCDFAEVTITAHNAAHTAVNPPATRTVTLSVSAGAATAGWGTLISGSGTWTPSGSTATYTWPGTQSSFTVRLRQSAVVSLTVNANDTFVTEDATEDPTINFVNSAFRVSNGANAALSIGNQIAAKPSNTGVGTQSLFLQAVRTDTVTGSCVSVFPNGSEIDIGVGAQCNNPATCTQNVTLTTTSGSGSPTGNFVPAGAGTYPATIRFRFTTANAEAPFFFSYADAGQITLQFRYITAAPAVTITGTSNAFVARPFGLAFRGANSGTAIQHATLATSPLLAAAGDNFTMTAAAYRWVGAEDDGTGNPLAGANITDNGLTPNFSASTTVNATGDLAGVTGAVSRGVGCASAATIAAGSWSGGAATIGDWCYSEAGNVFLGASATNYLAAGVNVSGNSGLDGTGAAGGYVGRFSPKRFRLIGTPAFTPRFDATCAPPSSFAYMDEPIRLDGFRMEAVNTQNNRTLNYNGAYALHVPDPAGGAKAAFAIGARSGTTDYTARITATHVLVPVWTQGLLEVPGANPIQITLSFNRNATNTPDGPFAATGLGIAPTDSDNLRLATYDFDVNNDAIDDHLLVGTTNVRFGRLVMQSIYGPSNRDLPITLETQYWDGTALTPGFTRNNDDNCTKFLQSDFALTFAPAPVPPAPDLVACETAMLEPNITFSSGRATLTMAKPGVANPGTVRLTANLDSAAGTYCPSVGAAAVAATNAAKGYLRGKWDDGAAYDDKPTASAGFGLYGSQPKNFIFFRENY